MSRSFLVFRDSREKTGWDFKDERCEGVVVQGLKTGDYTLKGYENVFVIERKKTALEFAHNCFEKRFERELERLEDFQHPFLLCEFSYYHVANFDKFYGRFSSIKPSILLSKLTDFQIRYKTKFILGGEHCRDIAMSLFKRVVDGLPSK